MTKHNEDILNCLNDNLKVNKPCCSVVLRTSNAFEVKSSAFEVKSGAFEAQSSALEADVG